MFLLCKSLTNTKNQIFMLDGPYSNARFIYTCSCNSVRPPVTSRIRFVSHFATEAVFHHLAIKSKRRSSAAPAAFCPAAIIRWQAHSKLFPFGVREAGQLV